MAPLESGNEHGVNILIVDDDPEMGRLIKKFLHREDYHVQTALNGSEALPLFQEQAFDLVISDLKMPGMSGFELIRRPGQSHPIRPSF